MPITLSTIDDVNTAIIIEIRKRMLEKAVHPMSIDEVMNRLLLHTFRTSSIDDIVRRLDSQRRSVVSADLFPGQ